MFKKIVFIIFAILFLNNIGVFAAPSITTITDNRSSYTSSEIPKYKKLEISFDVENIDTAVTNFQMPYDSTPPTGITAGMGITVDGLFLPPGVLDWDSAIVQPGFWYENFSMALNDSAHADEWNNDSPDWIHAEGKEQWKIRFAPTQLGVWTYKIRAIDASGQIESSETTFTVVSSSSKGFIRVSQADKRYFEFDNGEVFIPAGLSLITQGGLSRLWNNSMQTRVVENKLNFFRPWLTAWQDMPIYGGYGCDRSSYFRNFKLAMNSPDTYGDTAGIYSGNYAYKKAVADCASCNGCNTYCNGGFELKAHQALKPYTQYKFSVWIKTVNLQGDGMGAGLWMGWYDWVTKNSLRVKFPGDTTWTDTTTSFKLVGDNEWTQFEYTFTNKNRFWIPLGGSAWSGTLTLPIPPSKTGTAYFDNLSLKEVLAFDSFGPEQFEKGDIEFHERFSQRHSYHFDKLIEWAEQNGIYFKVSLEEKQEEAYLRLKRDGTIDGTWPQWDEHFTEYSGRAIGDSPLKWYEKAYWRYLIARWGFSPAIHSWEQFNEHDPDDVTVYQLANEFGQYMHQNDPMKHLVTTSFWTDFPAAEFWANTTYSNIDYADFHKYLKPNSSYPFWGDKLTDIFGVTIETRPGYVYGGSGYSIKIPLGKGPYDFGGNDVDVNLMGQGTWTIKYKMKTENLTGITDSNGLMRGGLYYFINIGNNKIPNAPSMSQYDANVTPGTYDWTTFSGTFVINDNKVHRLAFLFVSDDYTGGDAWIDNLEIIDPNGNNVYVNGEFDFSVKQGDDLALYCSKNSIGLGNVGKPIVWGETGLLDTVSGESNALKQDSSGVGFHNIIWSQINPSGVTVLYWYHLGQIFGTKNWITHFKPYVLFMENIPLNNGNYQDAIASANNANLRAWGQKDTTNNKAHLWIQNKQHTWKNVVDTATIDPVISGSVTIPNMNNVDYLINWWDSYSGTVIRKTQAKASGGNLTFNLPFADGLSTDVAVKINTSIDTATSPVLDWTGEVGYTNDGVDPESGYGTTNFIFRVKYSEPTNVFPSYIRLLLDKNGDGDYSDSGEIINMDEANALDNNVADADGKIYTKTVNIGFTPNFANISYKFDAFDGIHTATGTPASAKYGISLIIDLSMSVSSAEVSLLNLDLASSSQPTAVILNNTSDGGLATFTVQITNQGSQGSGWSAGEASGDDIYVLKALFTGINDVFPTAGDFRDDDIVTTTVKTATSAIFGDTGSKFVHNGTNVPAGESRKLWLLFITPGTSSFQSEENIGITFGIVDAN